jgi:NTE family protein
VRRYLAVPLNYPSKNTLPLSHTIIRPIRLGYIVFFTIILIFLAAGSVCQAIDSISENVKERPKIGVVLSGGGARGAAHIGVLKVLEEMRIPIDYLVGTSMGSIVGGLYASGMKAAEIEALVTSINWDASLQDNIPRKDRSFRRKSDDRTYLVKSKPGLSDDFKIKLPSGLQQGQNIDLLLKNLVLPVSGVNNFDDLAIPFRAVATDIVTGKAVVLASGDLAMAMRASMSVPAIFATVEIDGKLLVDGGVSNNLPVDVVREMGADIVIAIDISTPLLQRRELNSALDITQQLTGILTRRNTEEQIATLTKKDVFIVPTLGDITSASFSKTEKAVPLGVEAAKKSRSDLLPLSVSKKAYADYLASQQPNLLKRDLSPPVIDFIRLNNKSKLSDELFYSRLKIQEGSPLDVKKLEENIGEIYGLELFENIAYDIIEEDGKTGLVINIREKSWGPNYLQAGISLGGNKDGNNFYDLAISYSRTAINSLNGEWRSAVQIGSAPALFTEIYQPLDYQSRYFINPKLLYHKYTMNIYADGGNELAQYSLTQYGVDLALGREFGTWGELRMGYQRLKGDAELTVGQPLLPDYDFDRGEIYVALLTDTLDNLYFPRKGFSGFIRYLKSDETLGADNNFDQVSMRWNMATSWKKNSLLARTELSTTLDDNAPLQNRFKLGGLFNLSGFNEDQLNGSQLGFLSLTYMYKIGDFNLLPTYLGGSIETGNVWEDKDQISFGNSILAGSIFLGVDTFLGPIYLGYGRAEGNNQALYFYLGKKL